MTSTLAVSVIIPTLNEIAHIEGLVRQILDAPGSGVVEVLVADGGSDDGTRETVDRLALADSRVRLIDNPDRIQSAGVNRAAAASRSTVDLLIRMDAHAAYPQDYVRRLGEVVRTTGADSVVTRMVSVGTRCFQTAVAAVSNSPFGTGGALHRSGGQSQFVDHGHHAAFRRDRFLELNGYDETFVANEDAEFDVRLRAAGGRIWFAADIAIDYFPRATVRSLARQYYRYGFGRAMTARKHGERLRLRQMIPPAVLVVLAISATLALAHPVFLIAPLAYGAGIGAATAILARRHASACVLWSLVALPVIHLSWGWGFIVSQARGLFSKSNLS